MDEATGVQAGGDLRWPHDQVGFWHIHLGRRRLRRRQFSVADPFPVGGTGLVEGQCGQHLAMRGRLFCRRVKKFHLGEVQAPQRIRAFEPVIQPQVQDLPHASAHPRSTLQRSPGRVRSSRIRTRVTANRSKLTQIYRRRRRRTLSGSAAASAKLEQSSGGQP
uniref:Uncharacterized protein n=2 Tax=Triticum urartu TaxID=4572 RepID=A0A8R7V6F5_TRIUA